METLPGLLYIVLVSLIWIFNIGYTSAALDENGQNVCTTLTSYTENYQDTESYSYSYRTGCGWFSRCRRYRRLYRNVYRFRTAYRENHVCCPGYASLAGSNVCSEPICSPQCDRGTCVSPNKCSCSPGYHGPTCVNVCNQNVPNCEMVDCSSSFNSFCTKCRFHIDEDIKSYELINGQCEQLCSWRSDSNSCYPGTCTSSPDTCSCDHEFLSDDKCMTIDVSPTVSHCTIALQQGTGAYSVFSIDFPCNDNAGDPEVYISISGNWLDVNWQTRYSGPSQYAFPSYVHDFKVGVTSASVSWSLYRGGSEMSNGEIDCSLNHSPDDPNEGAHTCSRSGALGDDLENGDRLMVTARSENGGYLQLNNYDYSATPTITNPKNYKGQTVERYLTIVVDLEAPTHCSLLESPPADCEGNSIAINEYYTKASEVEVRWSEWTDDVSGIDVDKEPYNCQVCEMIAQNNLLEANEVCTPVVRTSPGTMNYEAEFQPKFPGVYCAVLAVNDIAGNTRYARRCFIFDDISEITIVEDKPMTLTVNGEDLNLLDSDVWTSGDQNVLVSWTGHFINQLHVDQSFLLPIKVETNVFGNGYDTDAHPTGRPVSAIDNKNGIVKFEVGIGKDTSGGITFPTSEPTWMPLPSELDETFIDSLYASKDGDTFGLWVRATDVMGNTKQDYVAIHIDSTAPQFDSIDKNSNGDGDYAATVFDKESGIQSVHWELLAENENILLSDGWTDSFNVEGDECKPTDCYCILDDKYCYKLAIILTPTLDTNVESDDIGFLRITIKNNALLEASMKTEVKLADIEKQTSSGEEEGGLGSAVLGGIIGGCVLLVIIIVLVALLFRRNDYPESPTGETIGHNNPSFTTTIPVVNPYSVSNNPPAYTPDSELCASPIKKPGIFDEEYASPISLGVTETGNSIATEIHPKDIHKKGELVHGNHSIVFTANVRSHGLKNVAVKSLKAGGSQSEIETIKHEVKMLRKLSKHRNIVQLYGFTSTRNPVALIMEYATYGDLSQYLQENGQSLYDNQLDNLPQVQLSTFARQVCSGMQHIHQHKIIHRNLGARNILVGEGLVCKITDFGRAVMADLDGTFVETEEIQLPVRWTAVEGLRERLFSTNSDVWSFGVLIWEIFSMGAKPYGNIPIKRIAEDVVDGLRLSQPTNCSDTIFSIAKSCWNNVPHLRPSFDTLFRELSNMVGNSEIASEGEEYMGLANLQR